MNFGVLNKISNAKNPLVTLEIYGTGHKGHAISYINTKHWYWTEIKRCIVI